MFLKHGRLVVVSAALLVGTVMVLAFMRNEAEAGLPAVPKAGDEPAEVGHLDAEPERTALPEGQSAHARDPVAAPEVLDETRVAAAVVPIPASVEARIENAVDAYVDRGPDLAPVFPRYGSLLGFEAEFRSRASAAKLDAERELLILRPEIEEYRRVTMEYLDVLRGAAKQGVATGLAQVAPSSPGTPMSVSGGGSAVMAVFTSADSERTAALVVDGERFPELVGPRAAVSDAGNRLLQELEQRFPR